MTGKERVLCALNHQEADRVPLDIGGINNTAMHYLVEQELKKYLKLKDNGTCIKSRSQGAVIPDQSIVDYFSSDTCCIYINEHPWIDNGDGTFTDMWNIQRKADPKGYYYHMCKSPLAEAESVNDILDYKFPELTESMVAGMAETLEANKDKCCILEGLKEQMFGLPSWLRGVQNFYMDLLVEEKMVEALLERMLDYFIRYIDFVMARVGDKIDIVKVSDDLGTQTSLLVSPEVYREKIKPYAAKLYAHIKDKYNKKLLMHSCGAIRPLLEDFIEMGIDAVNPVQFNAAGMELAALKADFGDRLCFWGGGVDTQSVLNMGTPEDVRKQVKHNLEIMKKHGGYVFAQVHNIQPGVPVENIVAMYETYRENAAY